MNDETAAALPLCDEPCERADAHEYGQCAMSRNADERQLAAFIMRQTDLEPTVRLLQKYVDQCR